jgi:hypothetical protein
LNIDNYFFFYFQIALVSLTSTFATTMKLVFLRASIFTNVVIGVILLTRIADKEIVCFKAIMITRSILAHPCFDKNTCSDGGFCHRLVKPNEETHDFECIDKDDECIGKLCFFFKSI